MGVEQTQANVLFLGGRQVALKPIARKARHADFNVVVFGIHTDVLEPLCFLEEFEPFLEGIAQGLCHLVSSTFSVLRTGWMASMKSMRRCCLNRWRCWPEGHRFGRHRGFVGTPLRPGRFAIVRCWIPSDQFQPTPPPAVGDFSQTGLLRGLVEVGGVGSVGVEGVHGPLKEALDGWLFITNMDCVFERERLE